MSFLRCRPPRNCHRARASTSTFIGPYSAICSSSSREPRQWGRVITTTALERQSVTLPDGRYGPGYFLETGYDLFAKRPTRPFPPLFEAFVSDPLPDQHDTVEFQERLRRLRKLIKGPRIRGCTNGDDAILATRRYIGVNDGVGAWSTRPNGHAALWSRLILHFWALEVDQALQASTSGSALNPTEYLQQAYEKTVEATSFLGEWQGTTTACAVILHPNDKQDRQPAVYVTNLGDSKVLILRPREQAVLYRSTEQWHWFDCPRQLGTNSPDTPSKNAVSAHIVIQEHDVILAMSDGVTDNLWEHEVVQSVVDSLEKWEAQGGDQLQDHGEAAVGGRMVFVARELVAAARVIAQDPFAESPFMEHAVEEGLAMEGGKLDDISVVAAMCRQKGFG